MPSDASDASVASRPIPAVSVLDLAVVRRGDTAADAFATSVALAQRAEELGFARVWYAEHHNMASIASSATAVLIAHIAAHTTTIRLGAGGIMLPNHPPLVIAEQFGTLATLHPGRIDLGLGRAPGTDQVTVRALRRDPGAADAFPQDVLELQGYLAGESRIRGVEAVPGAGTNVPLYILGSSLFGAQLAAALGLPYGFASHFAPGDLRDAVRLYRARFRPSAQCAEPYVIAGVNVVAAATTAEAEHEHRRVVRSRVATFLGRRRGPDAPPLGDDELDALLASPQGRQVADMMRHTAVGDVDDVRRQLEAFTALADADELMVVPAARAADDRLATLTLLAEAAQTSAVVG
ncbi:MAG: LLM class flavin-dependent oxidoreductase [Acidimicrobiia bacterium]|nr:LLM class flavin-dependent oxidoreductase [Acidimicrobiia bacterium]